MIFSCKTLFLTFVFKEILLISQNNVEVSYSSEYEKMCCKVTIIDIRDLQMTLAKASQEKETRGL